MGDFIRKNKIEIERYLPEFISKDETLKAIMELDDKEHEAIKSSLCDIRDQEYISSSTWGLDRWEKVLDIKHDADDDYEARRNRILLKLQAHNTSTLDFITKLIKRYCTDKSNVSVIEDNEHSTFHAEIADGSVVYASGLLEALNTYKPAHLAFDILLHYLFSLSDSDRISYGIADCCLGRKHISIPSPDEVKKKLWAGATHICVGKKSADIAKPDIFKQKPVIGMYQMMIGHISIGGIK